jgi:Leucine-rich repeat (LRR) protein
MIKLTLLDNTKKELELFDEITENNDILKIDCSFPEIDCWAPTDIYCNVRLTSLPNIYFPNLQYFDCSNNKLTLLLVMNLPLLEYFHCHNNQLTALPNMNFPLLEYFHCHNNQLTALPYMNFPNLQEFHCHNNQLTALPDNMNFPNLQSFNCDNNQLSSLPDNMNFPNLQEFSCYSNQLSSLPDNMNFPNLQEFYCSDNQLTSLPDNMNFPNLNAFNCAHNKLTLLPNNMNFPNLNAFSCHCNQLTLLHNNMNFPNLQRFDCSYNKLTSLPNNMNFPNLQQFYCNNNQLILLPDNMNFPNLQNIECFNNQLTSLPLCILNFRNLLIFSYDNNRIVLSLQMARFIDRMNNLSNKQLNVYNDTQNAHNSTIQLSVRDSINCITTRPDLQKYDIDQLHTLILWLQTNNLLTEISTQLLFEYIADTTVHSLLLLTFSNVLWFIIQTILTDFSDNIQVEIFKILNQEIIDADCRCFTGRMNRVINCLNGFSPLVVINIKDGEQIGTRS